MQMKIKDFGSLIPVLLISLLAGTGCQSAKKPASALPAFQAATPPIQSTLQAKPGQTARQDQKPKQSDASKPVPAAPATPAAHMAEPKQPEIKVDPVEEVIKKAEKEYLAGENEYTAGHKEEAKKYFDKAFDLLLGSPAEVRADARFEREYNRVMQGSNKLELMDLKQADNPAEQKSEPAPIDEANEVSNYPVDANLKAQATAEIKATHSDLPLMMTDQVAGYINYFSTRGRDTIEHGLERSGRYRELIERILKEEGVPQDLIYLAQAESGFHPYAVSRAGARGIWQFMGSRARAYNLHHDFFMDERQDPEKSTRAAARHLKDLYNQFGDWYLAMAAYNSGPGTVQSAVKRTGYADFWELYRRNVLPKETRNYVPIIVAETIMAKNPAQYGLDSITPDPKVAYDTVKINYPVDLRLVAECVDATPEQLEDLNPSLLRRITPKGHFDLHLPVGTIEKYQSAIASIPSDMRVWWRYHQVAAGETLMSVARSYHTTARAIAEANQLEMSDSVEAGAKLVIPIAPGKHSSADVQTYAKRLTVYHVKKTDTVQTVADNLGIPPATIRRWNRLKGDSLSRRRVLYVHLPVSPASVPTQQRVASKSKHTSHLSAVKSTASIRHTVKRGETLSSIATNYNTSVEAIKQTNSHIATLRPGMVLVIPQ
jgi:membrane-bound lytic murein transglycosylase D